MCYPKGYLFASDSAPYDAQATKLIITLQQQHDQVMKELKHILDHQPDKSGAIVSPVDRRDPCSTADGSVPLLDMLGELVYICDA